MPAMEVVYSRAFKRHLQKLARRYRSIKNDIEPIITALQTGETPGDQVTGAGHTVYKVRARNSDSQRGKSGGYRVIYYLKTATRCVLVTIYSKSDQGDVEPDALKQMLDNIGKELSSDD